MTTASIAVVAHEDRRAMADTLAAQVAADAVFIDTGDLGAQANHRRAWEWHTEHTHRGFAVVLEDDALPIDGFRDQLASALAAAPTGVVSLYLGTGHPKQFQPVIERAIVAAGADAHWLLSDHLVHAVAIAIRADLLPLQLDDRPTDEAITAWARRNGHQIAYSIPSICDHADTAPIITSRCDGAPRDHPRHAHLIGTRAHWTASAAVLA